MIVTLHDKAKGKAKSYIYSCQIILMNFFCLTSVSLSRQGSVIGLQLNKSKFKNLFVFF